MNQRSTSNVQKVWPHVGSMRHRHVSVYPLESTRLDSAGWLSLWRPPFIIRALLDNLILHFTSQDVFRPSGAEHMSTIRQSQPAIAITGRQTNALYALTTDFFSNCVSISNNYKIIKTGFLWREFSTGKLWWWSRCANMDASRSTHASISYKSLFSGTVDFKDAWPLAFSEPPYCEYVYSLAYTNGLQRSESDYFGREIKSYNEVHGTKQPLLYGDINRFHSANNRRPLCGEYLIRTHWRWLGGLLVERRTSVSQILDSIRSQVAAV